MNVAMRIFSLFVICIFAYHLFDLVKRGKLQLKFTLLWFFLCLLAVLCVCFPSLVYFASAAIGFLTPSNFIFLVAIAILLLICFSLSIAVSRYATAIKNLTQKVALLEKQLNDTLDGN